MKKFSLLALAAAGLLFGACSSEKDEVTSEQSNSYGLIEGQSSWIAVGISMPGDPITRANEDLIDGESGEYAVQSGTLYLFKGENENEAVFFDSYEISTTFGNEAGDNEPDGNTLDPKTKEVYTEITDTDNKNPKEQGWYELNGTDYTLSNDIEVASGKKYYAKQTGQKDPSKYGEITSTSQKFVQEIKNPSLGVNDKLYAYVILNDQGNSTTIAATKGTTTGTAFKKLQLKAIGITDEGKGFGSIGSNGLVMTNVPVATVAGGNNNPSSANIITFTEINKNAIYKTKAEAQADGAQMACIYVERAAVKVEVRLDTNFGIQLDGDATATPISASDVKWALGNVNYGGIGTEAKGYYNTRQFKTQWLPYNNQLATPSYLRYRMVGRTQFFESGHGNPLYRTYFGEDPNYTGSGTIPYNANTGLLNYKLSDAQYTLAPSTDASPVVTYTYENTFDENSQIYRNTTYVGVKVKIASSDFYTIEGQPNTKLANNDAITAVIKTRLNDVVNSRIALIDAAINADLDKEKISVNPSSGRTISDDVTEVKYDINVTVTPGTFNGTTGELPYTVTLALANVQTKTTGAFSNASPADATAITALAGTNIGSVDNPANSKVYKYVGGIAYYSARIQHFGDVETPWNAPAEAYNVYQATAPTACVYPANGQQTVSGTTYNFGSDHANAWLGRWGVVRNNWYLLTLKKIEGIGSPVPEDFSGSAGNTPDDNPKPSYFIAAEVHILPWVKRTQEVVF